RPRPKWRGRTRGATGDRPDAPVPPSRTSVSVEQTYETSLCGVEWHARDRGCAGHVTAGQHGGLHLYSGRGSSFTIALMTRASIGSIAVGKTAAIWPSRPMRYLWKFQRGVSRGRSVAAHL